MEKTAPKTTAKPQRPANTGKASPSRKKRQTITKDEKAEAFRYYCLGLTLAEISKLLNGVSVRTLERWQTDGKWTTERNPENIDAKVLQFYKSGKTQIQIAQAFGISKFKVCRTLKRHGLTKKEAKPA